MKVLVYDTETSDKSKNFKASYKDTNAWPRLVQLGYQIYENGKLHQTYQAIVNPVDFDIEPGAEKVHGISKKHAMKVGVNRDEVMLQFHNAVLACDLLVNHNVGFDSKVMGCELYRNGYKNVILEKKSVCTMLSTTHHCKLPNTWGGYKWPKLQELHKILFNEEFDGAHDALEDVRATARCFLYLFKKGIINEDGYVKGNKYSKKVSKKSLIDSVKEIKDIKPIHSM